MGIEAKWKSRGIRVGKLPCGPLDKISDVPGVTVGHCTVDTQTQKTGVTVVMPCADDMFAQKLPAAACVLNGFGKTAGVRVLLHSRKGACGAETADGRI